MRAIDRNAISTNDMSGLLIREDPNGLSNCRSYAKATAVGSGRNVSNRSAPHRPPPAGLAHAYTRPGSHTWNPVTRPDSSQSVNVSTARSRCDA